MPLRIALKDCLDGFLYGFRVPVSVPAGALRRVLGFQQICSCGSRPVDCYLVIWSIREWQTLNPKPQTRKPKTLNPLAPKL